MLARALSVLLLLSATAAAQSGVAPVQMVRGRENHLLVPVNVNGQSAHLLLDTGSDVTFIEESRAKALGVRIGGAEIVSGGRGFPRGTVDNLRVGNLSLGQTQVALYDPAQFRGPVPGKGGKPADGILGLDLLRRYKAVINCRTQQLFLQSGPAPRLNLTDTTRALGFTRIPIHDSARGFISVPCEIAGKAGAVIIDTGAFVTVFNEDDLRAFQLEETPTKLTARTPFGRVRAVQLARINDLRIGGVAIEPQRFAVMNLFPAKKPLRTYTGINRIEYYDARAFRSRLDLWGLLGAELLYQHSAIVDLDSMALFLK